MNKLLRQVEEIPLSEDDLLSHKGSNSKLIGYDELKNVNNLEELLDNFDSCYIFLSIGNDTRKVGHWIVVTKTSDSFEYFDSYGFSPEEELHITHQRGHIIRVLSKTKKHVNINHQRLQEFSHEVNTCGRHSYLRAFFYHLKNDQYIRLLNKLKGDLSYDELVSLMTLSNLPVNQDGSDLVKIFGSRVRF